MNGEFLRLGRTWWMTLVIIVGATVMFGMSQLTADQWLGLVKWVFTAATAKSVGQKIAEGIQTRTGRRTNP